MLAIGATPQKMGQAIAQTKLSDRCLENGTILADTPLTKRLVLRQFDQALF